MFDYEVVPMQMEFWRQKENDKKESHEVFDFRQWRVVVQTAFLQTEGNLLHTYSFSRGYGAVLRFVFS